MNLKGKVYIHDRSPNKNFKKTNLWKIFVLIIGLFPIYVCKIK